MNKTMLAFLTSMMSLNAVTLVAGGHHPIVANQSQPDEALSAIASYVHDYTIDSDEAYQTARACLADTFRMRNPGFALSRVHQAFRPCSSRYSST